MFVSFMFALLITGLFTASYPLQVFVDPLTPDDLLFISSKKFPSLADGQGDRSLLSRMIAFNRRAIAWQPLINHSRFVGNGTF